MGTVHRGSCACSAGLLNFSGKGSPVDLSPVAVARLILAEDCEWQPEFAHLAEGQKLSAGPLALKSGSAVVRFDGGAELVLTGHTRIQLISGNAGRLDYGDIVVRAEDGAEGFIIDTPATEFVDLGTEFTVSVHPSGKTKMQVLDGEVSAASNIITAGNAIVFEDPTSKVGWETIADPNTPRFEEMLRRANPRERRDLMTVYEGFFHDEGTYSLDQIDGGKGWAHPWRLRVGEELRSYSKLESSDLIRIPHGKMNAPWPVRGGRLGALELPPGQHVLLREFLSPVDLSKDHYTFFSFMISSPGEAESESVGFEDLSLAFRSTSDYYMGKVSFGWSNTRTPLIRSGGGRISRGTRTVPVGETVFCIGKITSSATEPDVIHFRCYHSSDSLHLMEPAEWDVESHSIDSSSKLDLLEIVSNNKSSVYIDEIRIGPTWRSVTPIDPEKLPTE